MAIGFSVRVCREHKLDSFRQTSLWTRTLGSAPPGHSGEAIAKLLTAYSDFRGRASALTSKIATALPSLTVHDATHLDALWETADLIAGPDYPLNPAEAFVFGGAVLLHDAALCFEAYEGGQEGLRATIAWKDAFSAFNRTPSVDETEVLHAADFAAMRSLHASRAADLAFSSWPTPEGEQLYLIESHELRKHYGRIIGSIASSHHWPIEDVLDLPPQINAIPGMPREWRVDPVKIACLLRCADAAHIDSRRAPDFLRALTSLHGVSAQHWTAQNWLEQADIDTSDQDGSSIVFTSGKPFDESNADAWWVAYDAIKLVNRELMASFEILEQRPQSQTSPPFRIRRVSGASSPTAASKWIVTEGWEPKAVEIHVSNLESLISSLGGEKLYGTEQKLCVVLRELIQNARDAVNGRRKLHKDFKGRINVRVRSEGEKHTIIVEDNGLGMSSRVMTGPLLDFGSSFWSSQLSREEFPGLSAAGNDPVGKFGIGFYSIFMAASSVSISSRRYNRGTDNVVQLRFPKGLSLRPLISTAAPAGFGSETSTAVSFTTAAEIGDPNSILVGKTGIGGATEVRIGLRHCLAIICAGLDVDVYFSDQDETTVCVHKSIDEILDNESRFEWLYEISGRPDSVERQNEIRERASRLRPITRDGKVYGLAALGLRWSPGNDAYSGVPTVGGLSTSVNTSGVGSFEGVIDYHPASAKREASPIPAAGKDILQAWVREQFTLLPNRQSDPLTWCRATWNVANLNCDPSEIATFFVRTGPNVSVCDANSAIDIITNHGMAFYHSVHMEIVETHHSEGSYENFPTFWPIDNGTFILLDRDKENPNYNSSIVSVLERAALSRGVKLSYELRNDVALSRFGRMSVLIITGQSVVL